MPMAMATDLSAASTRKDISVRAGRFYGEEITGQSHSGRYAKTRWTYGSKTGLWTFIIARTTPL